MEYGEREEKEGGSWGRSGEVVREKQGIVMVWKGGQLWWNGLGKSERRAREGKQI